MRARRPTNAFFVHFRHFHLRLSLHDLASPGGPCYRRLKPEVSAEVHSHCHEVAAAVSCSVRCVVLKRRSDISTLKQGQG